MSSLLAKTVILAAAVSVVASSAAEAQLLGRAQVVCDVDAVLCVSGLQGLEGVHDVAVSPDGDHVYACSLLDSSLLAFSRDESDRGRLTHIQTIVDTSGAGDVGLNSCRGVAVSPDGQTVYTAALLDNALSAWSRNAVTGLLTFIESEVDSPSRELAGANGVAVSGDGEHVYVVSRSDDGLAAFSREADGSLTSLQHVSDGLGGVPAGALDTPEGVAVSPDDNHVYAVSVDGDSVVVFSRNSNSGSAEFGELTFEQHLLDDTGGVDGIDGAARVVVSPDGKHVYVGAERGGTVADDDWIGIFSRNTSAASASFGHLTFLDALFEADFTYDLVCFGIGDSESGLAISPDGALLYAVNPFQGTLFIFERDATTGALTAVQQSCDNLFTLTQDGLAGANSLALSPNGRDVYLSSPGSGTLGVWSPIIAGNCNREGEIDAGDPVCSVLCLVGSPPDNSDCVYEADCNCSGGIDAGDPICVVLRLVGGVSPDPCE